MPPKKPKCGRNYHRKAVVRGRLLNGFDIGKKHTVPAIAKTKVASPGRRTAEESEFVTAVSTSIIRIRDELWSEAFDAERWLTEKQADRVNTYLRDAQKALEEAENTYAKWEHRANGAFPLQRVPDALPTFNPKCKHFGEIVKQKLPGSTHEQMLVCPAVTELTDRPKDRDKIATYLIRAAEMARCAEYTMWRLRLYKETREAQAAPGALEPSEAPSPELQATPRPPVPPHTPGRPTDIGPRPEGPGPDVRAPGQSPVPEAGAEAEEPPEPPVEEEEPEVAPVERKPSAAGPVALGIGVAGLVFLMLRK